MQQRMHTSISELIKRMNSILHILKCPVLFLTGISCPGCGLSRAWLSALKLDFSSAMYYHPLFWTVPLIVLLFIFEKRMPKKLVKILMIVFIAAFLAVYVIRMFSPDDTVVRFTPDHGLIIRIIKSIFGGIKHVLS